MKTAMQELIDAYYSIDKFVDFDTWIANNQNRLLENEKKQIIKGYKAALMNPYYIDGVDYYNKTYNQNK